MAKKDRRVALRVSRDPIKSMQQYEELRGTGNIARAVVIAEFKNGDMQVLGQGMSPTQIAGALMVAADAIAKLTPPAPSPRPGNGHVRLQPHIEPAVRGTPNEAPPRFREIKTADDGTLIPPPGENFISCGECAHPQWYALGDNETDQIRRIACSHCGNEVLLSRWKDGSE